MNKYLKALGITIAIVFTMLLVILLSTYIPYLFFGVLFFGAVYYVVLIIVK